MDTKKKKLVIIFSLLIGLPLLLIFLLATMRGCSNNISYEDYEKKMIEAAEKYAKEKKKLPKIEDNTINIELNVLEEKGYIKKTNDVFKNEECLGSVSVRNNNGNYIYIPNLQCKKYNSKHLIDTLLKDVVESKSGLYKTEDGYVYKGLKVNNYVSINKKLYRIISIDNNNILKLILVKQDDKTYDWDKKYNVEKKQSIGKNDYLDSNIYDILAEKYQSLSSADKKHFVSYDLCIGKRSLNNKTISNTEECSVILPNQYISLLNVYDYAMASYDGDCIDIKTGACQNFNYLFKTLNTTWLLNGVADNSYDVFYYSGGYVNYSKAYFEKRLSYVFYIDGNEIYTNGDGTKDKPYILK